MAEAQKVAAMNMAVSMRKLAESDFQLTEHKQPFYTVTAPVGTTREAVLMPAFWTHVAKRMVAMSEIRIMPLDGAWYGIYLVLYADAIQAKLVELSFHDLGGVAVDAGGEFYVKWGSPAVKFRVLRTSDDSVLKDGFDKKEQAERWMVDNLKRAA
jgi:hypothetical protein